ncbi:MULTISPECIES: putative phage abortive infection protein [unclassified Enterococcus]|uniref:putative phage abortive infection protein n=1 Tax=unclassified Enterococcus TaxID=2608891 RepID=UPI001F1F8BF3|nr:MULTISPECIES: putative phage abortive infection protein [unclassified Enterococcus]
MKEVVRKNNLSLSTLKRKKTNQGRRTLIMVKIIRKVWKNRIFKTLFFILIFLGFVIFLRFLAIQMYTLFTIIDSSKSSSADGFLGFWGGFLGAILSGIIALVIVRIQIIEERQNRKEEKNDSTFYYLYSMLENRKSDLMETAAFQELKKEIYDQLMYQLSFTAVEIAKKPENIKLVNRFSTDLIEVLEEEIERIISGLDSKEMQDQFRYYKDALALDNTEWDSKYLESFEKLMREKRFVDKIKEARKYTENTSTIEVNSVKDVIECYGYLESAGNALDEKNPKYSKFLGSLLDIKSNKISILDEQKRKSAVEAAFKKKFNSVGQYYKIVTTIIQFLETSNLKNEKFHFFVNTLRADMFLIEEILLYYYIEYTSNGSCCKKILQGSGIFDDLKMINYEENPSSIKFYFSKDMEKIVAYNEPSKG